jgi:UDP-N-acetylmuramate dehydrogenase
MNGCAALGRTLPGGYDYLKDRYQKYLSEFDPATIRFNVPLAQYNTFAVGGPADVFHRIDSCGELERAFIIARQLAIPVFILGSGSNILVRDGGFRGIVLHNRTREVNYDYAADAAEKKDESRPMVLSLYQKHLLHAPKMSRQLIAADSGANLQTLIRTSLKQNLCGLDWLAGVPGTVGGALYNNAHYAGHQIDEFIVCVEYLDSDLCRRVSPTEELEFGYDASAFRHHKEWLVLRVFFSLEKKASDESQKNYQQLLLRRDDYKGSSAGCVFANLSPRQMRKAGLASSSVGYINDKILGINGTAAGGAMLGKHHGNFITNENNASASDVLALIGVVKKLYRQKFGIRLRTEIRILGRNRISGKS